MDNDLICSIDVNDKKKIVCKNTDEKVKELLDDYIQQLIDCQKKESMMEQFACTMDSLGDIVKWCQYAVTMHSITKNFVVKNGCYTKGMAALKNQEHLKNQDKIEYKRIIAVQGIMLHSVGSAQPNAKVFVKGFNKASKKSCAHAFIDGNDGKIYQVLPWCFNSCHSGKHKETRKSVNETYIGIEMCEPAEIKYIIRNGHKTSDIKEISGDALVRAQKVVKTTYESAVKLFAALCTMFKLDPLKEGVIISHREGNQVYKSASEHADPEHLWRQLKTDYTMDTFRADVKKEMDNIISIDK